VAVIAAATFYTAPHAFPCLSYAYWYFAGMIAARRTQLALAQQRARVPARLRGVTT
jgi:hypothetical protein